jgi:hypothetical protein
MIAYEAFRKRPKTRHHFLIGFSHSGSAKALRKILKEYFKKRGNARTLLSGIGLQPLRARQVPAALQGKTLLCSCSLRYALRHEMGDEASELTSPEID